jgi:hypothetical protein
MYQSNLKLSLFAIYMVICCFFLIIDQSFICCYVLLDKVESNSWFNFFHAQVLCKGVYGLVVGLLLYKDAELWLYSWFYQSLVGILSGQPYLSSEMTKACFPMAILWTSLDNSFMYPNSKGLLCPSYHFAWAVPCQSWHNRAESDNKKIIYWIFIFVWFSFGFWGDREFLFLIKNASHIFFQEKQKPINILSLILLLLFLFALLFLFSSCLFFSLSFDFLF